MVHVLSDFFATAVGLNSERVDEGDAPKLFPFFQLASNLLSKMRNWNSNISLSDAVKYGQEGGGDLGNICYTPAPGYGNFEEAGKTNVRNRWKNSTASNETQSV